MIKRMERMVTNDTNIFFAKFVLIRVIREYERRIG